MTTHDAPLACTLTPGETERRIASLADLASRGLRGREPIHDGERLTFAGSPVIEREVRSAVAAEASCCRFLTMDLRRSGDRLVLDITGPEQARPIIAALFAL